MSLLSKLAVGFGISLASYLPVHAQDIVQDFESTQDIASVTNLNAVSSDKNELDKKLDKQLAVLDQTIDFLIQHEYSSGAQINKVLYPKDEPKMPKYILLGCIESGTDLSSIKRFFSADQQRDFGFLMTVLGCDFLKYDDLKVKIDSLAVRYDKEKNYAAVYTINYTVDDGKKQQSFASDVTHFSEIINDLDKLSVIRNLPVDVPYTASLTKKK